MLEALKKAYLDREARLQARWEKTPPRMLLPFWAKLMASYFLVSTLLGGFLLFIWPSAQAYVEGEATARQVRSIADLAARMFDVRELLKTGFTLEERRASPLCRDLSNMLVGADRPNYSGGAYDIYRYHISIVIPRNGEWVRWIADSEDKVDTTFEATRYLDAYVETPHGWDNCATADSQIKIMSTRAVIDAREAAMARAGPTDPPPRLGVAISDEPIISARSLRARIADLPADARAILADEPGLARAALVVEAPKDSSTELSKVFFFVLLGMFIATSIVVLLVALFITWRINRPISALHDAMLAVGEGDLTKRVMGIHSRDEFGRLAWQFNHMVSDLVENKSLVFEVDVASRIQRELIPPPPHDIPLLDIAGWYATCKQVGGDYYDFIRTDGELWIAIGDAVGHGIDSGIIMATARASIRALLRERTGAGQVMNALNRLLSADLRNGNFLTCAICCLRLGTREAIICSAGHEPVVHYRAATRHAELILRNGPPLGVSEDLGFKEYPPIPLQPGDVLLFTTDGVRECHSPSNELFGRDRLLQIAGREHHSAQELIDDLKSSLEQFAEGDPLHDDISVVVVRVRG